MVRVYKRTTDQALWTPETMHRALQACREKGLSINAASRRFDIPRTTLQRHLKGKVSGDCKLGRFRQVFSSELGG